MTNQIFSYYASKKDHLNHNNEFELTGWVFFYAYHFGYFKTRKSNIKNFFL